MTKTQTTSPQAPKTCLCGCGAEVARRFLPGHDARLKGALKRQAVSRCGLVREPAIRRMLELGWGAHLDVEVLASLPVRSRATNGRFAKTVHAAEVEFDGLGHVDAKGVTHSHQGCPDVSGATTPDPRLDGWACGTCIHVTDPVAAVWG